MDDALRDKLERLTEVIADSDEQLKMMAELITPLYSYELMTDDLEIEEYDSRAHQESWEDMVRLQAEGVYPSAFSKIRSPVLMLHGAVDPTPGGMVSSGLKPYLPQMEYIEWERCGHYPWLETGVHEEFSVVLRDWLTRHA